MVGAMRRLRWDEQCNDKYGKHRCLLIKGHEGSHWDSPSIGGSWYNTDPKAADKAGTTDA